MISLKEVESEIERLEILKKSLECKIETYGYIDFNASSYFRDTGNVPLHIQNPEDIVRFAGKKVKITIELVK